MRTADISSIVVSENRIRKSFDPDAIRELADSIRDNGLYQAPVMRETNTGLELIAGERRLRAMLLLQAEGCGFHYDGEYLPPGTIPYTLPSDLDEISTLTIELEENVVRRDIDWRERVIAEERLHALRLSVNPTHTFSDTARIVHGDKPTYLQTHEVKRDIMLAQHLNDPEVRAAKNEREAANIARRNLERAIVNELANRTPQTNTLHILHHGSCLDLLATIPPRSVDVVLTDPPYGINMHENTPQSGTLDATHHNYDDTWELAAAIVSSIANAECIKPDAHAWVFCDIRMFTHWVEIFTHYNWYVWPHPLIWSKGGLGSLLGHANGPRHCYDAILFAQRGFKRFKEVIPDVIDIRGMQERDHAAQKPVALYEKLLRLSCDPNDTVLDPCCGSGTIFPAATAVRCRAIGIEIFDDYHSMSKLRMDKSE